MKSSNSQQLNRTNSIQEITSAKEQSSYPKIREILRRYALSPYSNLAFGIVRHRTYNDIQAKSLPLISRSWEIECRWLIAICAHHSSTLNGFIANERKVNSSLLLGDFESFFHTLKKLTDTQGASLWALARKLSGAALSGGAGKVAQELNEVVSDKNKALQNIIAQLLGWRSDRTQSSSSFIRRVEDLFDNREGMEGIRSFIEGVVLPSQIKSYRMCIELFEILNLFPLTDRYLFLRRYLFSCLHQIGSIPSILHEPLADLASRVDDTFLRNLTVFAIGATPGRVDAKSLAALDAYTTGAYQEAVERGLDLVKSTPDDLLGYLLTAKGSVIGGYGIDRVIGDSIPIESTANQLILNLHGLYASSGADPAVKADLERLVLDLDCPSLGFGIQNVTSPISAALSKNILPEWALFSHDVNPLLFERFGLSPIVGVNLQIPTTNSPTLALFATGNKLATDATIDSLSAIPHERLARITALRHYHKGDFPKVIATLELLQEGDDFKHDHCSPRDRLLLKHLLIDVYHKMGLFEKAIDLCVNSYIHDGVNFPDLPVREILQKVIGSTDFAVVSSPARTILLAECGYDAQAVHSSLYQYLRANGVDRPSDLLAQNPGKREILLLSACSRPILAFSLAFRNTSEITQERIAICQALANSGISKQMKAGATAELEEMMGEMFLVRATEEVDSSKIYIAIDNLKQIFENEYKDMFARIETLRAVNVRLYKLSDLLEEAQSGNKKEKEGVEYLASIRVDAAASEFSTLFSNILSEYLWNRHHGLNPNLSMTLRHGTLLGQIRKPFQDCRLVTELQHSTKKYKENEHWINELNLDAESAEGLNSAFSVLAHQVDGKCEDIRLNYIQIRRENLQNPDLALFDFVYDDAEIRDIWGSDISKFDTPEEIVNAILAHLNSRLSGCLTNVRDFFEHTISDELLGYLSEFESKLQVIAMEDGNRKNLLREVARCRTEVQESLRLIASWFTVQEGSHIPEFTFEQLFNFSFEQLQRISPRRLRDASVSSNAAMRVEGRHFSSTFHLLYILLNNALRHAGLPADELEIALTARSEGDYVVIDVSNNLPSTQSGEDVKNRVSGEILAKATDAAAELISMEGGTGFAKIWRILRVDLGSEKATLSCESEAPSTITVRVRVPVEKLTK